MRDYLLTQQRGSVLTEAAIVMPLLFMLTLGVLSLADAILHRLAVDDAINKATRAAMVEDVDHLAKVTAGYGQRYVKYGYRMDRVLFSVSREAAATSCGLEVSVSSERPCAFCNLLFADGRLTSNAFVPLEYPTAPCP